MNRWNGRPGIVAVIIFAVFYPPSSSPEMVTETPLLMEHRTSSPPHVANAIVGTRRAVSPRATEEVAKTQTSNTNLKHKQTIPSIFSGSSPLHISRNTNNSGYLDSVLPLNM